MVFELSDIDVESMRFAANDNKRRFEEMANRHLEKKQEGKCTCPIKIETTGLKKYKKNLEKHKRELTYKRRHTNGYDLGRPLCPIHDLAIKSLDDSTTNNNI